MKLFVKPAKEGLIVRDPNDKHREIPDSGKEVKRNAYWLRRLRDGDVVEAKKQEKSKASETPKKKQKKKAEEKSFLSESSLTSKGDE